MTTILYADCAGYSRMMRADEEGTYRILQSYRQTIDRLIGEHDGRIFGSAGDSVVAEFPSPVEAVRSAVEIQQAIAGLGSGLPEHHRMQFRIGINLGDVMIGGDDLIGDGVKSRRVCKNWRNPTPSASPAASTSRSRTRLRSIGMTSASAG